MAAYPRTNLESNHNSLIGTFRFEAEEVISKTEQGI